MNLAAPPRAVAASEFELITLTRSLVGLGPAVPELLRTRRPTPTLSPNCVELLQQTLARGCVRRLAIGGWRRQPRLQGGARVDGRLWQRYSVAPELHFSPSSLTLLQWLLTSELAGSPPALRANKPHSLADDFLLYLAMVAANNADCMGALTRQRAVRASPLCWLAFAHAIAAAAKQRKPISPPSFATHIAAGIFIEALETELASHWCAMETQKLRIARADDMHVFGDAQRRVLEAFLTQAHAATRPDLAFFVIDAAATILRSGAPTDWLAGLAATESLSVRAQARTSAAHFWAAVLTLAGWAEQARQIRFIDDDYEAAQLFLLLWEQIDATALARTHAIHAELTSLHQGESP